MYYRYIRDAYRYFKFKLFNAINFSFWQVFKGVQKKSGFTIVNSAFGFTIYMRSVINIQTEWSVAKTFALVFILFENTRSGTMSCLMILKKFRWYFFDLDRLQLLEGVRSSIIVLMLCSSFRASNFLILLLRYRALVRGYEVEDECIWYTPALSFAPLFWGSGVTFSKVFFTCIHTIRI